MCPKRKIIWSLSYQSMPKLSLLAKYLLYSFSHPSTHWPLLSKETTENSPKAQGPTQNSEPLVIHSPGNQVQRKSSFFGKSELRILNIYYIYKNEMVEQEQRDSHKDVYIITVLCSWLFANLFRKTLQSTMTWEWKNSLGPHFSLGETLISCVLNLLSYPLE